MKSFYQFFSKNLMCWSLRVCNASSTGIFWCLQYENVKEIFILSISYPILYWLLWMELFLFSLVLNFYIPLGLSHYLWVPCAAYLVSIWKIPYLACLKPELLLGFSSQCPKLTSWKPPVGLFLMIGEFYSKYYLSTDATQCESTI